MSPPKYLSLKKHFPTSTFTVYKSHESPSPHIRRWSQPRSKQPISNNSPNANVPYIQQLALIITLRNVNSTGQWLGNFSAGREVRWVRIGRAELTRVPLLGTKQTNLATMTPVTTNMAIRCRRLALLVSMGLAIASCTDAEVAGEQRRGPEGGG